MLGREAGTERHDAGIDTSCMSRYIESFVTQEIFVYHLTSNYSFMNLQLVVNQYSYLLCYIISYEKQ